jgi:uncharacterized pyridoxal phosphate-containing UPF0001 family protein
VAVSKTFAAEDIRPVIEAGQRVFGENRVQEAQGKWPALKQTFADVELHLISSRFLRVHPRLLANDIVFVGAKPR